MALVADGVGGAAAGEVASATAAYVVSATALARFGGRLETILRDAVAGARLNLRADVRDDESRTGMATTLTAVLTDGHRVLGHVGDSRAYVLRAGRLAQVSRDHIHVQLLVGSGRLTRADVPSHPWRNAVLRSLQAAPDGELEDVDLVELDVAPGDRGTGGPGHALQRRPSRGRGAGHRQRGGPRVRPPQLTRRPRDVRHMHTAPCPARLCP